MTTLETLNELERIVRDAKSVPLSASVVIPKEEALGLLQRIREGLPRETEEAKEVVSERDRLLSDARREAAEILERARAERSRLLAKTEVVQAAESEAKRVLGEAESSAGKLKHQADDYVDAKLANFEILLQKVMRTVGRGREQLQHRLAAAEDQVAPLNLEDSGEISGPIPAPDDFP